MRRDSCSLCRGDKLRRRRASAVQESLPDVPHRDIAASAAGYQRWKSIMLDEVHGQNLRVERERLRPWGLVRDLGQGRFADTSWKLVAHFRDGCTVRRTLVADRLAGPSAVVPAVDRDLFVLPHPREIPHERLVAHIALVRHIPLRLLLPRVAPDLPHHHPFVRSGGDQLLGARDVSKALDLPLMPTQRVGLSLASPNIPDLDGVVKASTEKQATCPLPMPEDSRNVIARKAMTERRETR